MATPTVERDSREQAIVAVTRFVRAVAPDAVKCRIVFDLEDGSEGVIPIPLPEDEGDGTVEEAILEVLEGLKPGTELRTKVIALQAGYPNNSWFRGKLSAMRKDGRIVKGPNGFRLKGG